MSTSNTPQKSTGISSLYIVKCICAFLVVTCHTPMGQAKEIISPIAMAAVPIFFLISVIEEDRTHFPISTALLLGLALAQSRQPTQLMAWVS